MGPRLATDHRGYWHDYGCGSIALKCAGCKESRPILGASDRVIGIDTAKAEKAADIVFLMAVQSAATGTDSLPDELGSPVGPTRGMDQKRLQQHGPIDGWQRQEIIAVSSFQRIVDAMARARGKRGSGTCAIGVTDQIVVTVGRRSRDPEAGAASRPGRLHIHDRARA